MTQSVSIEAFHLEQLFALSKGDIIELPGLMAGIDPEESVVAMVTEINEHEVTLRLTYNGVWLATRTLKATKSGIQWEN
jgi:hypothetical protein